MTATRRAPLVLAMCLLPGVVRAQAAADAPPSAVPAPAEAPASQPVAPDLSLPPASDAPPPAAAATANGADGSSAPATGDGNAPLATGAKKRSYNSTVRGDRADTLRRNSGSRTLITQEDIERAAPESTSEMLARVPGLQVRQEDQSGFRLNLGVRGLSPTRSRLVLVEEDGVPVVVSPYGEPELYYMTSIERIQSLDVQKGSDVLMHGPQTVGASIQLYTWEPTATPSWYTAVSGGQRGFFEAQGRYSGTTPGGVGYVAQAMFKRGDGYRDMGFNVADAFGKLTIPTNPGGELHLKLAVHYEMTNTTYTGLTDTLYLQNPRMNTIAPHDHFGIQRYEIALTHDQKLGTSTRLHTSLFAYQMNLDLRLQDFDRSELPGIAYVNIPDPTGLFFRNTTSLRERIYDVVGAAEEVEQKFNTGFVKHKLTFGLRLMYDGAHRTLSSGQLPTANSGDLLTDDSTEIFGLAGWVEDQISLTDWLLVTPAFRIEYSHSTQLTHRIADDTQAPHDVNIIGNSSSNGPTPGVGVIVGKPTLNLFTSFYLGYSAPRVSQAITPDGKDTDVHAENSSNYEVGARGRVGNWLRAEGDFFMINFGNELVSNNPLSGSDSEFIDGGKTQHLGVEGTLQARIGRAAHLPIDIDIGGQYTFTRSRFVGGTYNGHTVPYSPAQTAVATLDLAHKLGFGFETAFSYIGSQYSDELNTVQPGPTGLDGRIPAYTTLDFTFRYHNARTGLGASLAIKNALDRVYISDRLPDGIFTAGFRQIFATLSWSPPA